MKIALCFSGQPRKLEESYNQFKTIFLEKYDIDVFVHTWFDSSYAGKPFDYSIQYQRNEMWNPNTVQLIHDLYKPKSCIIEPQKEFDMSKFANAEFQLQRPFIVKSMWFSIKESNRLKLEYESKTAKYDCVIRCRFDTLIKKFELSIPEQDLTKIHISGEIQPYCNDQFAFSNSENMDYYSSLYDNLENYFFNHNVKNLVNENILTYHLRNTQKHFHTDDMAISIYTR